MMGMDFKELCLSGAWNAPPREEEPDDRYQEYVAWMRKQQAFQDYLERWLSQFKS